MWRTQGQHLQHGRAGQRVQQADEYWLLLRDSYWVMEGLLLSEMASTVKGMLQNFLDLVKT